MKIENHIGNLPAFFVTFALTMRHPITKKSLFLISLTFLTLLCSCGKNEFTVSGALKGIGERNLTITYTAYSNKHDELVTTRVPCNGDNFSLLCATRHPTIVWIMASDGKTLHALYAEKGDKIRITGPYDNPLEWKISGNEVSGRYSTWMAKNVAILSADDPEKVNSAIARYVADNPKDRASALMLLTLYHRNSDEAGFNKLWQSLDIPDKEKERLLHVAIAQLDDAQNRASSLTITPITLRCKPDSSSTINPASARATILYFWRRSDGPHKGTLRILASQPEDVQIADIYLDPDTVQWRYMTQNDTFSRRNAMWAFGGEMNLSLRRLAIPSDPFIIVADRKGRQVYRGISPSDASSAAAKIR